MPNKSAASQPHYSIVIPAHNEAAVILRLLESLRSPGNGSLEIIVACNGCSDNTADICRQLDPSITVLETNTPSKVAALNIGDEAASYFPRFYLDADIEVTRNTIDRIAEVLTETPFLAAAPMLAVNDSQSSWLVKAFYSVWRRLPYHLSGMVGSGFYALSEEGRARFRIFPDLIADDGFVRAQFDEDERLTVRDASFTIVAPTNLRDLIKVKTRSRLGLWELAKRFPETQPREKKRWGSPAIKLACSPADWLRVITYCSIVMVCKARAMWLMKDIDGYTWERDESSRRVT